MSKNTIVAIVISLVVGGGIGYLIASKGAMDTPLYAQPDNRRQSRYAKPNGWYGIESKR
jgi:hypothetical protein